MNVRDDVRYVSCENILGAAVRTGGEKTLHGRKNGDSVLIDFRNNFVAVADGPERNPFASQSFLKRIYGMLSRIRPHAEIGNLSLDDVEKRFDEIIGETNSIIKTVRYTDNTTFTALFIVRHVRKALLLHTGDSVLYHFRIDEGKAEKVSQTNHCFVGRIDRLYQTKLIDYYPDSRFLLATDGFYDLIRDMRNSTSGRMEKELLALLKANSVDQLPRVLIGTYDVKPEMSDDLGLVVLNPDCDYIPKKAYYLL
jgi:serine/threonine protein phosphatase PrpC